MLIFKDALGESKDELLSDSYEPKEVFDGIAIEADCAMIQVGGESFDTGANASAEEAEEGADDGVQKVNNIVHSFRLQEIPMDKKGYGVALKDYMKALVKHLKDLGKDDAYVADFQKRAQKFGAHVLKNFGDYQTFKGEHMDGDGMFVLLNYREDGVTPFVTLWKDGLIEEKV